MNGELWMNYVSVVVTYNRKEFLKMAVESLLSQTLLPQKIIIIDNASTDGTPEMMQAFQSELIDYVRLPENLGGSGGFYRGLDIAKKYQDEAQWVSLSDDDAIFENDYFEKISNVASHTPKIKAFSGTVQFMDHSKQLDQRQRITSWNHFDSTAIPDSAYKSDFYIDLFTFCGCVINFDLVNQVGMPRQDFFIWWDDIEYSIRVRKYSKILNVSDAILVHHTKKPSVSSRYQQNWKEYYWFRNRTVTVRTLGRNKFMANLWAVYQIIAKVKQVFVDKRFKGQRWKAIKVTMDGVWDGFRGKMGANSKYMPN